MFRNRAPRAWKGVRTTVIEQKSEIRAENVRNKPKFQISFGFTYKVNERRACCLKMNDTHIG